MRLRKPGNSANRQLSIWVELVSLLKFGPIGWTSLSAGRAHAWSIGLVCAVHTCCLHGRAARLRAQQLRQTAQRTQTRQRIERARLRQQLREGDGTCQWGCGTGGGTRTGATGVRRVLGLKVSFLQLHTGKHTHKRDRINDIIMFRALGCKY